LSARSCGLLEQNLKERELNGRRRVSPLELALSTAHSKRRASLPLIMSYEERFRRF